MQLLNNILANKGVCFQLYDYFNLKPRSYSFNFTLNEYLFLSHCLVSSPIPFIPVLHPVPDHPDHPKHAPVKSYLKYIFVPSYLLCS